MALYACLFQSVAFFARGDPDRYYHFAISRMTAEGGLVRALPQAAELGWHEIFYEKEFLFHGLGALAYGIAGDSGVTAIAFFLGAATVAVLFEIGCAFLSARAATLLVLATILLQPNFVTRLALVRPHVWGTLFFSILCLALVRRGKWLALASGAFFSLGYHAMYIPLTLLAAGALAAIFVSRTKDKRLLVACGFGVAGIIIGVLVNPYFPANMVLGFTSLKIALSQGQGLPLDFGSELQPLGWVEISKGYLFPFVLMALGLRFHKKRDVNHTLFLGVAIVFWTAFLKTPRLVEYTFPVTAIVGFLAIAPRGRSERWALALTCLAFVLALPLWYGFFVHAAEYFPDYSSDYLAAIDKLPPDARGKKVFNCEWSAGAYLLYRRPDVRFIDFSDPILLAQVDSKKSMLRLMTLQGRVRDAYSVVHDAFASDYVLCASPTLVAQLEKDRHFRDLHAGKTVHLFEVLTPAAASRAVPD
ncbi:MAG: hypothetical protein HY074_03380 [Deltaproteobacteria bacterium]|nr:hypothetical protein [Deltaproteobacteria bacterium]